MQPFFFYFLSTFRKCNLTHLTTDVMFSGQSFVILAMFGEIFVTSLQIFEEVACFLREKNSAQSFETKNHKLNIVTKNLRGKNQKQNIGKKKITKKITT